MLSVICYMLFDFKYTKKLPKKGVFSLSIFLRCDILRISFYFFCMDILLKSVASAIVTAIILLIAKFSGPRLAGAIGGIPIVFAVSYVLVILQNRSSAQEFLVGGIYGALAGIFFSGILIWMNHLFPKYYWATFVVAYILCFIFALLLVNFPFQKIS